MLLHERAEPIKALQKEKLNACKFLFYCVHFCCSLQL